MPILNIHDEVAVTITYDCNWNCKYCAVKNSYDFKQHLTYEDVLKKLEKIKPNSNVTIFGGEPGLVQKSMLIEYIKFLKNKSCNLYLETNGTFLYKYPDLITNFVEILYHCSNDLDLTDEIYINKGIKNIQYMIIIHDDNIKKLKLFLEHNIEISKFNIVEATYPYIEMHGPTLSSKNKNYIITHFSKHMTNDSIFRLLHGKDFDKILYLT